ncbi:MAG: peptidylprolyl isomerase [Bryobacteraceae bacterium]|jgi:peptidyl-prolyl cis-trans isomerase A (cyclophilin A)
MRLSLWIAMFAAGAVALAGCSSSSEPKKDQPAADAAPAQPAAQKQEAPASFQVHAPATFNVTFDTTKGPVVVEVHRDWAPIGADHFYELVKSGYFDGARFFRVVPNFVVQFGIAADPAATRKWKDANLVDDPVLRHNVRGTLVYAKTDQPNTRTTQLFINLVDNSRLDGDGFAPFATITSGMDAVDAIYAGYGEAPQQPLIESQGNAYLQQFPKLDFVRKATIQ